MKLTDLEPQFLRYEKRWDPVLSREDTILPNVHTIEEAQGIEFLCPKCFVDNKGRIGTHAVICWSRSRGVPDDADPKPGRWTLIGTGYHDLTLNGDPPGNARSVLLLSGCKWHGFVTNGDVT